MKLTKFAVLIAGITGIAGFCLPLVAFSLGTSSKTLSGLQMLAPDPALAKAVPGASLIAMVVFFPVFAILIFGLAGTLRGRFGRALGIGSLVFGLASLSIWASLNSSFGQTDAGDVRGVGMWLILASGLGSTVGGFLGVLKPDRREARSPRHAASTKT